MGKVGRWVTDPYTGSSCTLSLDSGDKLVIKHEKAGHKTGWLMIDRLKALGLNRERVFACNLDSPEGIAALEFLKDDSPLRAFIRYLETCRSVDEVKSRCAAVPAIHRNGRPASGAG